MSSIELEPVQQRNQDGTISQIGMKAPAGTVLQDGEGKEYATKEYVDGKDSDPTDTDLTDGAILIGDADDKAAGKTLTGDVTMTREGVTTLRSGMDQTSTAAGVDEGATPSYTVAGIAVGDELTGVLLFDTGVPTARPLADFTVGSGAIAVANNAVDNQGKTLVFFWKDRT